jgi:hypothetical protein
VQPPPPLAGWAEFTIMMECSSESGHCQSTCNLSSVGGGGMASKGGKGNEMERKLERGRGGEGGGWKACVAWRRMEEGIVKK